MNIDPKIVLATSIAPKGINVQQEAINTWTTLGFDVLSVNWAAEISDLEHAFPDVEFVPVQNLEKKHTSRNLVFFDQILNALKERAVDVSGIINSDIHLRADPSLLDSLSNAAKGSMVFGSRININSLDQTEGELYKLGYDFFFYGKDVLGVYPSSPFRIGAPWWDLWAPMIPIHFGVLTKYLLDPIAFHVRHKGQWKMESNQQVYSEWQMYANLFIEKLGLLGVDAYSHREDKLPKYTDSSWISFCQFLTSRQISRHTTLTNKALHMRGMDEKNAIHLTTFGFVDSLAKVIPDYIRTIAEEISFEAD